MKRVKNANVKEWNQPKIKPKLNDKTQMAILTSRDSTELICDFYKSHVYEVLENKMDTSLSNQKWKWSKNQIHAMYITVQKGQNLFITGGAGVGKTGVLQIIIRKLIEKYPVLKIVEKVKNRVVEKEYPQVYITAPTGTAAFLIKGVTLQSYLGLPSNVHKYEQTVIYKMIQDREFLKKKVLYTRAIIIDEISMCTFEDFRLLDMVTKMIKQNMLPFGGIQLIVSGDFLQLPPVKSNFCFLHPTWKLAFPLSNCLLLKTVFRQQDIQFIDCLNQIRLGQLTDSVKKFLSSRLVLQNLNYTTSSNDGLYITSVKSEVENINEFRYKTLPLSSEEEKEQVYNESCFLLPRKTFEKLQKASTFSLNRHNKLQQEIKNRLPYEKQLEYLKNQAHLPPKIYLKKGTQVMLTVNLNTQLGLVNGANGKIIGFVQCVPKKRRELDEDADEYEEEIKSKKRKPFQYDPTIRASTYYPYTTGYFPIILFTNGVQVIIKNHVWSINCKEGIACYMHLPLEHAWAITIHRSQGLSLDQVTVDLRQSFEEGQAYVALSRAKTPNGLKLIGYKPDSIKSKAVVIQFYEELDQVTTLQHLLRTKNNLYRLKNIEIIAKYNGFLFF